MSANGAANIDDLVEPGRVHRRVYTDPAVFDLEMDRIFGTTWIYVGHASQIPASGDFFQTTIGSRRIVVARHDDGQIYAFHNRCAHRGMEVCTAADGNTRRFVCPYHGWAYHTDGSLAGVPHDPGYGGRVKAGDPAFGLTAVPRISDYRGFVFASLAEDGPDLPAHLGRMTAAIDNMTDRAPDRGIALAGGTFRVVYRGNWKLHMENANDLMHASIVHESSVDSAAAVSNDMPAGGDEDHALQMFKGNGLPLPEMDKVQIHGLDDGHSFMGSFYRSGTITQKAEDPVLDDYRAHMDATYGENRASEILGWDTFNHLIYPNLVLNPKHAQFRLVRPLAVDRTEVLSGCFKLKGAPDEMFHAAVRFQSTLNSPSSMIASDDNAVFNGTQRAIESDSAEWIEFSRNLGADRDDPGGGKVGEVGTSELPMRAQYTAWKNFMTAG